MVSQCAVHLSIQKHSVFTSEFFIHIQSAPEHSLLILTWKYIASQVLFLTFLLRMVIFVLLWKKKKSFSCSNLFAIVVIKIIIINSYVCVCVCVLFYIYYFTVFNYFTTRIFFTYIVKEIVIQKRKQTKERRFYL